MLKHTPYLIQRCEPTKKSSVKAREDLNVHELLKFDYMGSSEFEFGAIPECFRRFHKKLDKCSIHEVDIGEGEFKKTVYVLATPEEFKAYVPYLQQMAEDKLYCKEYTGFGQHFRAPRSFDRAAKTTFWLDIANDVAWNFRRYDLQCFGKALDNTIARWNREKAAKANA